MELSWKSEGMIKALDRLFNRTESIQGNKCSFCGKDVFEWSFRDFLSEGEYTISGLCQQCQDSISEEFEEYE